MHELGASAGLNLLADQVRLTWPGGAIGPQGSPLHLSGAWEGAPVPPADVVPHVVERVGCDLDPVDITTTEGRLHLTSFVWPDQLDRLERLRAAYQLVETVPITLVRADLLEHLRSLRPVEGSTLVVFHSSTWFYLDEAERAEAVAIFDRLGAQASATRPWCTWRASTSATRSRPRTRWCCSGGRCRSRQAAHAAHPGDPVQYADSPAHGLPVTWQQPHRVQEPTAGS